MITTESRDMALAMLELPTAGNVGPADTLPCLRGSEQNRSSFPPTRRERANPVWDNLWIDLGGEG
jgi:hypothetical protein